MTTYAERLAPYANFKNKHEMDEQVTMHLQHIGYELNKTDHCVLNHLKTHAVRYPGVFQQLLETIAEAVDKSVPTVKRILTKLVKLGIIARKKTRKRNNSRAGATIYQFQFFVPSNEPKKIILCNSKKEIEKPCDSKVDGTQGENKPFISLIKTSLKDSTYPKDGTVSSKPKIEKSEKKVSLRQKIAQQLKARNWSVTTLSEFATIAYGQIKTLLKQDATLPKEYLENLVYKKFLTVVDNKKSTNPFGLFSYLIKKEFTKLLGQAPADGEQCELELTAKQGGNFEISPQWLIDQEQDPIKKARLIKQNEIATQKRKSNRGKEALPNWFVPLSEQTKEEPKETVELDIEAEHKRIMQALGIDA